MNTNNLFNKKTIFQTKYRAMVRQMVEIRKSRGLTQRDLADKLKVPHCYIGRAETFERRLDIIEMVKWLKALNLTNDEIIDFLKQAL